MANTPVSTLPYAALADSPNANTLSQGLATALDHVVIPKYASTAARDAANTAPVDGDACYVSPFYYRYTGTAWVKMTTAETIINYQGADQSVNNNTLTNATGIKFTVVTGKIYLFDAWIVYAGALNPTDLNFKVSWGVPGTNLVGWVWGGLGTGNTNTVGSIDTAWRAASTPLVGGQAAQANNFARMSGIYISDANGTVNFKFSQNATVAGAGNAAILRGSATGASLIKVEVIG